MAQLDQPKPKLSTGFNAWSVGMCVGSVTSASLCIFQRHDIDRRRVPRLAAGDRNIGRFTFRYLM